MTEYWKSHAMYWCELCRCWMNDTKAAKLNHERGAKHQENLARKLRDMSRKADAEKKQQEQAAAAISSIEQAARERFEADQKAAQEAAGSWRWVEDSQYYYNAKHRWYYDPKTQWYYGGEPVAWTQKPGLPSAALFGVAPHEGGPVEQPPPAAAAAGGAASGGAAGSSRAAAATAASAQQVAAAAAAATGQKVVVKKTVMQLPSHPQSAIGGHQMPTSGRIGGAKGVGSSNTAADTDAGKRKRDEGGSKAAGGSSSSKKPVDPAEAEALARREAARRRVEERTKAAFGLT